MPFNWKRFFVITNKRTSNSGKISGLAQLPYSIWEKGYTDDENLRILKQVDTFMPLVQIRVGLMSTCFPPQVALITPFLLELYYAAIADTISALLEITTVQFTDALIVALWQSYGIKSVWVAMSGSTISPEKSAVCKELLKLSPISQYERRAKDLFMEHLSSQGRSG